MGGIHQMKHLVPIMVILLFVSTSFIGAGNQVEELKADNEQDELLDNLAFYCYDDSGFGSAKYEYLKEELLEEYPYKTDVVETELQSIVSNPIPILGSPPMDSPWPMKCHDYYHTSRSPYSTDQIDGLEKWRRRGIVQGFGGVISGPVISNDGTIFYGDKDHYIYALYPNGTMKWAFETDAFITSSPALAEDGTLYMGSWDEYLYALNSTNGKLIWKVGSRGTIHSSPAIDENGIIYFGNLRGFDEGEIVAINPNGTKKWIYPAGFWTFIIVN